jgi:hypothetical protein
MMAIALFFALLGISVFCSTRSAMLSATLSLSEQYAAATTDVQRSLLLAAGQAAHASSRATPETTGFFFVAVGGLFISVVMLRSEAFGRAAAYVGILASLFTLGNDISIVLAPSLASILMPISGLLWAVWWILVSLALFRLAQSVSGSRN